MTIIKIKNNSVLCVDDEELILRKIKRKLEDEELEIFLATSANEALNIIEREDIAVFVVDLNMPEINGIELLKLINHKNPDIINIIFSVYSSNNIKLSTLYLGNIYHYISKELVNKKNGYKIEFIPVIKRAVERYNLIQENKSLRNKLGLDL